MAAPPLNPYQLRVAAQLAVLGLPSRSSVEQAQQRALLVREQFNQVYAEYRLMHLFMTAPERWRATVNWKREWERLADQKRRIREVEDNVKRAMDGEEAMANGNIE